MSVKSVIPFTSLNRSTNQANLKHMVSRLNIELRPKPLVWRHPEYQIGRLRSIRTTLNELIRSERIEKNLNRAEVTRQYTERLISEAVRHGDRHKPTMELADWWFTDKTLIPKLFKVLVERYRNWPVGLPYTRLLRAPKPIVPQYADDGQIFSQLSFPKAVLELRGNPYPPLPGPFKRNSNPSLLHNILLEEARKDYFRKQTKIQQNVEREVHEEDGLLHSTSQEETLGSESPATENK